MCLLILGIFTTWQKSTSNARRWAEGSGRQNPWRAKQPPHALIFSSYLSTTFIIYDIHKYTLGLLSVLLVILITKYLGPPSCTERKEEEKRELLPPPPPATFVHCFSPIVKERSSFHGRLRGKAQRRRAYKVEQRRAYRPAPHPTAAEPRSLPSFSSQPEARPFPQRLPGPTHSQRRAAAHALCLLAGGAPS